MPGVLVLAAILAVLAYILWAPLHHSLVAFLALIVLVPTVLVFPNGLTSALTVPRLAALALALRLVICIRRGEVPSATLRPTAVHAAFVIFLGVAIVTGVLLAAPATNTTAAMNRWFSLVEQFAVFAIVLAVARTYRDTMPLARSIAALVGVAAVIAVLERLTGSSWARALLENVPGLRGVLGAIPLEQRGGGVRVRVAAEFALEFGWIGAMVLPLVAVVAMRTRRWTLRAVPFLLALGIYWSNSRSAFLGIVVAIAIVALFGGDRRATGFAVGALALAGVLYIGVPSLRAPFSGTSQTGSTQIREQRLPEIAAIVNQHTSHGLGFEGLVPYGFPTTDASYLLAYAETGVVGVGAFAALMIVVLVYCGCGLRAPPSWNRLLGTAAFAGLVAALIGGVAFDLFTVGGSADLFWVLAALGVLVAERNPILRPKVQLSVGRLAVVPIALAIGVLIWAIVPSHAAVETPFDSLWIARQVYAHGDTGTGGEILLKTVCERAHRVHLPAKTEVDCFDPHSTPGFGVLRIDAPSVARAQSGTYAIINAVTAELRYTQFHASTITVGKPTWTRTAPVWLSVGALMLALTCPWPRRRRIPTATPRATASSPSPPERTSAPSADEAPVRHAQPAGAHRSDHTARKPERVADRS